MDRMKRFACIALLILLALALSGCEALDKLKARSHLNRGVKAYTSQRWDEAEAEFAQAMRLDPSLTIASLYLATTYRAQFTPGIPSPDNLRHARQSIETFEEVLEAEPDNTNAMANIAGIYSQLDENEEAVNWYRRLIEVDPDNPEPYYGIGTIDWKVVNAKTGNNGENVENLTEEERAEVTRVVEDGVEALRKALELNPRYSEAMQFLNLLYRERSYLAVDEEDKKKWENEAFKLALQALEIRRQQEAEAERARRSFSGAATQEEN